jgi:putative phage-type endonuclease
MIDRQKIDLDQNTPPWHDWRKRYRMASDAATVVGVSPYAKPADLWQVKNGLKTVAVTKPMIHGSNLEPTARAKVAEILDVELEAECCQYGAYGASLDAITKDGKIKVEIKCPFSENSGIYTHLQAEVPEIVPYVFWQLVHQEYVCPTQKTYLFVYFDDEKWELIDATGLIKNDHIEQLLDAWDNFYQNPPLIERDDEEIKNLVMQHRQILAQEERLKIQRADIEKLLKAECSQDTIAFGSRIVTQSRKGSIDYKSITELNPVNLEAYRKPASSYQVIKHPKEVSA